MRLHFSIGGYDNRRTFFDVVTVSNSAEFKSFLLIMCIDAPESTTNSLSSGLKFDGAGTYFPKVRRMLLCFSPLIFEHFWPASTLLHGHLALATLSPPVTDPHFLERWGYAGEVHLGKSFRAKDFGLEFWVSNVSVTYNGFCESNTSDWFQYVKTLPQNR